MTDNHDRISSKLSASTTNSSSRPLSVFSTNVFSWSGISRAVVSRASTWWQIKNKFQMVSTSVLPPVWSETGTKKLPYFFQNCQISGQNILNESGLLFQIPKRYQNIWGIFVRKLLKFKKYPNLVTLDPIYIDRYCWGGSITVRLTSCLTGLDLTKQVKLMLIHHKQSNRIQT